MVLPSYLTGALGRLNEIRMKSNHTVSAQGSICPLSSHCNDPPRACPSPGEALFYFQAPTLESGFTTWLSNGRFQQGAGTPVSYLREPEEGLSDCFSWPPVVTLQISHRVFAFPDTDLVGKDCGEMSGAGPGAS